MMQKIIGILFFVSTGFLLAAKKPLKDPENTKWISLQEAEQSFQQEKRPILIDLYTDWCGWCKVMDRKTYRNQKVSAYLANKFYTVKFNAEGKSEVLWKGKKFSYNSQYRTHEFAMYLSSGQLSYPTTVILPADGSAPQAIPGYLEPKDFEIVLKYFGEGYYGKMPFQQFQRQFKSTW